jgi:hypothetical protein
MLSALSSTVAWQDLMMTLESWMELHDNIRPVG